MAYNYWGTLMKKPNYNKIGAVLVAIFFLGVALTIPSFSATSENNILTPNNYKNSYQTFGPLDFEENTEHPVIGYEQGYIRKELGIFYEIHPSDGGRSSSISKTIRGIRASNR